MIGISGIIGGLTLFSTSGLVLGFAGPGGVLIVWAINGAIAVSVMEGLSEMIELWPISNAMMEFVDKFVDKDLALVVGITYWYLWYFILLSSWLSSLVQVYIRNDIRDPHIRLGRICPILGATAVLADIKPVRLLSSHSSLHQLFWR